MIHHHRQPQHVDTPPKAATDPLTRLLQQAVEIDPDDAGEQMARDWLLALLENGEAASNEGRKGVNQPKN
jgi:hypothetical protein